MGLAIGMSSGIVMRGGAAAFVFSVKTDNVGTSDDNSFTVPTVSGGTYNCTVDWGDGSTPDVITTFDDAAWTHDFTGGTPSPPNTYTISITGTITGLVFNNGGDRLKMLAVTTWGQFATGVGSFGERTFYGCANMTVAAGAGNINMTGTTSIAFIFRDCSSITQLDTSRWDVSLVEDFESALRGMSSIVTVDGSNWVMSSATNLLRMCQDMTSLTTLHCAAWNVSNVVNMSSLVKGCVVLATFDVSSWVTSSLVFLNSMLEDCFLQTDVRVDLFDIEDVTQASAMFSGVTLTTARYEAILIAWEAQAVLDNVNFGGGNSTYTDPSAAATARAALVADHTWTITDGGTA